MTIQNNLSILLEKRSNLENHVFFIIEKKFCFSDFLFSWWIRGFWAYFSTFKYWKFLQVFCPILYVFFFWNFNFLDESEDSQKLFYRVLHKDRDAILFVCSRPLLVMNLPNLIPNFKCWIFGLSNEVSFIAEFCSRVG